VVAQKKGANSMKPMGRERWKPISSSGSRGCGGMMNASLDILWSQSQIYMYVLERSTFAMWIASCPGLVSQLHVGAGGERHQIKLHCLGWGLFLDRPVGANPGVPVVICEMIVPTRLWNAAHGAEFAGKLGLAPR
jgi:hypothetical protein